MRKQLKKWANDLHQIPEIGLEEYQTTNYLMNELKKMGYDPLQCLDTGCYVYIDHKKEKTLAFRSDIDGLSIQEESCHPCPSKRVGYMHACGHDGHMAMLLGFAKAIINKELPYNVLLIFQPAEEYPGGALPFLKKGIFKKYNVSAVFGFHLSPSVDFGEVTFKEGPMMAECGALDIEISGKSAHAGLPQDGLDTILVASQLIQMYPTIITKKLSPTEPALIHIGQFLGGSARNIVCETVNLHGTIRAYSEDVFNLLVEEMEKMNQAMEIFHGCQIKLSCPPMYPAVINDEDLSQQLFSILNAKKLKEPVMLAEDFSYYQQEVPGVFMFLGTKTSEHSSPLHASTFYFDESVLEIGVNTYLDIIHHIKI